MLGSVTPLGERGRQQKWLVTVVAYLIGTLAGGAAVGGALGAFGAVIGVPRWHDTVSVVVLAGLALAGAALDLQILGLRLPTSRRQVREAWLWEYRGWVYGLGFGFQLGLGVVTVVNSSLVYLAFAAAFLSGSVGAGAAVGATFGLFRWLSVLPTGLIDRPSRLSVMSRMIDALDRPSARVAVAYQLSLSGFVLALAAIT